MTKDQIVASRQYGWKFVGPVKVNKTMEVYDKDGQKDIIDNPIAQANIVQSALFCGQAATHQMYVNASLKLNPAWTPSKRNPAFESTDHPCIVAGKNGEQIRILNPIKSRVHYTIDGIPATPEQIELIEQTKPSHDRAEASVKIMFPYLHNIQNVE